MHPQWVRDVRDLCDEKGVPFLFKQWGEWVFPAQGREHWSLTIEGHLYSPGEYLGSAHLCRPVWIDRPGKKLAGRELDGRTWDEYPA